MAIMAITIMKADVGIRRNKVMQYTRDHNNLMVMNSSKDMASKTWISPNRLHNHLLFSVLQPSFAISEALI